MKKLFLFLISLIITVFSNGMYCCAENTSIIEDEIVKSGHVPIFTSKTKTPTIIKDELLDPKLYGDHIFRLGAYTNKYKGVPIEDELIDKDFLEAVAGRSIIKTEAPDDWFIEKIVDTSRARIIKPKTKYDFTKKQIPINIRIAEYLKNTKSILEGDSIPFVAENDFEINGTKFERGTTIYGRVESISESDKMGTPECLRIDNFYIKNGDEEINLYGSVSKIGANRSIWVYPLYQAGNICFYVAGFVFVPIHGGRVKLKTEEMFTVYYETQ